ncbi:MAG: hypothetical protein CMN30_03110 [Sandaracinus sp.]|nr:hypothetical protein [Sandaracinus sp.]
MSKGKQIAISFVSGLIFAIGLVLGGMTQPSKVVGFLDFFGGAWDPSLAFVMGGAILFHAPAYFLFVRRHPNPGRFSLPTKSEITLPLVGGSVLFGIGWGLGGFCPGPGLASIPTFGVEALTFVGSMSAGMLLHHVLTRKPAAESQPAKPSPSGAHPTPAD